MTGKLPEILEIRQRRISSIGIPLVLWEGQLRLSVIGSCGHKDMYKEMKAVILKRVPETKVTGQPGRQKALQTELGKEMPSFEVEIENQLVYSKLKTMAFPDFDEVADVVEEVAMGGLVRPIKKQQPINCCIQ